MLAIVGVVFLFTQMATDLVDVLMYSGSNEPGVRPAIRVAGGGGTGRVMTKRALPVLLAPVNISSRAPSIVVFATSAGN